MLSLSELAGHNPSLEVDLLLESRPELRHFHRCLVAYLRPTLSQEAALDPFALLSLVPGLQVSIPYRH